MSHRPDARGRLRCVGVVAALIGAGCRPTPPPANPPSPTDSSAAETPPEPVPPRRDASADQAFSAAAARVRAGADPDVVVEQYTEYLDRFADDPAESDRVVAALLARGAAHQNAGRDDDAERDLRDAVERAGALGIEPASESADWPAEAQFRLGELASARLGAVRLDATEADELRDQIQALVEALLAVDGAYDDVMPWRRLRWALAAMVRRAQALEFAAARIDASPIPDSLREDPEASAAYAEILDVKREAMVRKAASLYRECVVQGRSHDVHDQWTRAAATRLAELGVPIP